MRDSKGRFEAGVSGNPNGRPKALLSVRDLARAYTEEAISILASIMSDANAPANSRISAATELLNRGYGRAVDQKAMVLLSQQHEVPKGVHDLTTSEIISMLIRELPSLSGQSSPSET